MRYIIINGKAHYALPDVIRKLNLRHEYFVKSHAMYIKGQKRHPLNLVKVGKMMYMNVDWYHELANREFMTDWFINEVDLFLDYLVDNYGTKYVKDKLQYKHHISTLTKTMISYKNAIKILVKFRAHVEEFENWKLGY